MKNSKCLAFICVIAVSMSMLSSCGKSTEEWQDEIYDEISYSGFFWMDSNMTVDELRYSLDNPKTIKEIVYLAEPPTEELEEGILAFYLTNASFEFVGDLTLCAEQDNLDLAAYGLSNPITLDEVLNKRQEVSRLIADIKPQTLAELKQLGPTEHTDSY
jgi:hypothetical protein